MDLCTLSRGLTCSWAGTHNPMASKNALMAATSPSSGSWTSWEARSESHAAFGFGYGQVFMNGYFDANGRPKGQGLFGDFSDVLYTYQGLNVQAKNAIAMCSRVERGAQTLIIQDTNAWANHWNNKDGNARSYAQWLENVKATIGSYAVYSFSELAAGAAGYDGSVASLERYKRIIILMTGGQTSMPAAALIDNLRQAFHRGAPVVCIQADGYNSLNNQLFNALFSGLGMAVAGANYLHLYAESIDDYKNTFGDAKIWTAVDALYTGIKFFHAGAAAYTYTRSMPVTSLDGYEGRWAHGDCVDVPYNDDVYIPSVVVTRESCCFGEGDVYQIEFDVPASVIKPTDYRTRLPQGILGFNWWHEMQVATYNQTDVLTATAAGWWANGPNGGAARPNAVFYRGVYYGIGRSYNLFLFDRATGNLVANELYDVHSSNGTSYNVIGDQLAARLNALTNAYIVLIVTCDEPTVNSRPGTNLYNALLRIGASASVLRNMKYRSAYMLMTVPGEADIAFERYKGDEPNDRNALITARFDFRPDGAMPMDTRLFDPGRGPTTGTVLATVQGVAERAVICSNFVMFRNAIWNKPASDPQRQSVQRLVSNILGWVDARELKKVLIIPSSRSTAAWNLHNTTGDYGLWALVLFMRAAGYTVDVYDYTAKSSYKPIDFQSYSIVVPLVGPTVDDVRRWSLLVPVLHTLIKGGMGMFCVYDAWPHASLVELLRLYSIVPTAVPSGDAKTFNVDYMKQFTGEHPIFNEVFGTLPNDIVGMGLMEQRRALWPYCIDGESLVFASYKDYGRVARLVYKKPVDPIDTRRVFTLDAFTKLTDKRFKKIDMSDTDQWPLTIELPCVEGNDNPQWSVNDVSMEEGNSGHTVFPFTVSLAEPLRGKPAIIKWRLIDGTATTQVSDTSRDPKSLLIDADGNWHSVYLSYDVVRVVADGAFPKFYNGSMPTAEDWQRQYIRNVLDFMRRGRAKGKILFLGDQPNFEANYATLGTDPTDFGIAFPETIRGAGYTLDAMVWQNFKGGAPKAADFLQYQGVVFVASTTGAATAIPEEFAVELETAIRQGTGLFAITDHDVFTKSFTTIMNHFAVRIYNDPTESSMVYFDACREVLEYKPLLENITVSSFRAPGSISAFIHDTSVLPPKDIDPPYSGELVFDRNDQTHIININVIGEKLEENDEFFFIEIYDPTRGDVIRSRGTGTIINDDGDVFNTRQFKKLVSWNGYIAGGDVAVTPGVDLFLIPVPSKYNHEYSGGSVWISRDRVNVVESDRSGWSGKYKFTVAKAVACNIKCDCDDDGVVNIYNSAGARVYNWTHNDGAATTSGTIQLEADTYTVDVSIHNDANGNNYGSNPGYIGVRIWRP